MQSLLIHFKSNSPKTLLALQFSQVHANGSPFANTPSSDKEYDPVDQKNHLHRSLRNKSDIEYRMIQVEKISSKARGLSVEISSNTYDIFSNRTFFRTVKEIHSNRHEDIDIKRMEFHLI
ncbi:hypothetical protein AVEN_37253-1 [Araneus ventricosus]|uniref:Uncharacterized protein n=1 Tax=Araneus ventricosus TaxID=182803 RepID=A0A4Y2P1L4_ARAVE|nr:hypothetical protein AVEN_37253-1 [Araneus ventricosus]